MKIYEIGTGYTPIPAQVAAATESIVEELTKAFMAQNINVEIIDICAQNRAPHDLPITEVATRSGFQSLRSFNRVYRDFTGIAPSEEVRPSGAVQ